ncbi:MAG: hypothetical protein JRJ04_12635 [Deltaproteobacteria bacterium]|nr:hypothetical protein [Deltaproteobacteria bacterium]
MQHIPEFRYYLSDGKIPIDKSCTVWNWPFPLHFKKENPESDHVQLTYGDYYRCLRKFIEKDNFAAITAAASQRLQHIVHPEDISTINIHLEKHGPYYHPARIRMRGKNRDMQFSLNVAISLAGKRIIEREYGLLKRLNSDFPFPFLPEVYHLDSVSCSEENHTLVMFLGEWCEGFHEFHISDRRADEHCEIMRWDPLHGKVALNSKQIETVYQKAALILTCYYNPLTFEQIFPWYHPTGDFIIKVCNDTLDVKLISVRRYGPMVENEPTDLQDILEAMLVFLLNLSMWTRIDRIDGVEGFAWADVRAVNATIEGFFKGLSYKKELDSLMEPLSIYFKEYLCSLSQTILYDLSAAIVNTYHPKRPERMIIQRHLKDHVAQLYAAILK